MATAINWGEWEDSCEKSERMPLLVRKAFGETHRVKTFVTYQYSRDIVIEIFQFCINNKNISWLENRGRDVVIYTTAQIENILL